MKTNINGIFGGYVGQVGGSKVGERKKSWKKVDL